VEIKNINNFKQGLDFSGLRCGSLLATDIDCFMEFQNKLFIFIEVKYGGSEIPLGQRIAYERLCTRLNTDSSNCFVLVTSHNISNESIIDICKTNVYMFRHKYEWVNLTNQIPLTKSIEFIKQKYL
jgi:hypothetical protein